MALPENDVTKERGSNFINICRTCMQENFTGKLLCEKILINGECLSLSDIIVLCASIQIGDSDGLSQMICEHCQIEAERSFKFRRMCENSNNLLRNIRRKDNYWGNVKEKNTIKIKSFENCDTSNIYDGITDCKEDFYEDSIFQYSCTICKAGFKQKNEYIIHLNVHNGYKCKECSIQFITKEDLEKHEEKHSNYKKIPDIDSLEKRTCHQCNKVFQYRSSMLKHIKRHSAPPRICLLCQFVPSSPSILAKHMEIKHPELKKFNCVTCGKGFFKETNLKLHMTVHTGVKKHICEICGMSFALSGNLTVHKRLHTGERPYTCSHCGRTFTQHSALKSHEAGHSDHKDHICPECGVAFSRAGALRNHRKRHSKERPFSCTMCRQAFTFSSELKRHMTIHTGDKTYSCEVCGRSFNRNTNLKVHRKIHTGETPHVCKICGKGFVQVHCLQIHMNTHMPLTTI